MSTNASTSRRSAVAAPDERLPRAATVDATARWMRRIVAVLLIACSVVSFAYAGLSVYIATRLAYEAPKPLIGTPAAEGLDYRDITFPSREDHLQISGWFIPGHLPSGRLTTNRTIIMVHGSRQNRTDPAAGALALSAQFARHGFAVLAFDMRGMGVSPPAPFSLGYFEQRDVLGAVDFLCSGLLPYPELGRTHAIGGWGISMGAATLLLAAAREPAIQAVVSDSAYAAISPILEREVPKSASLPPLFTPGALLAAHALYGMDFYAVRPVDIVASIAPRPIFFLHGDGDDYMPPPNMGLLVDTARTASNAQVQSWLCPGVKHHAQCFHVEGAAYVTRLVTFFTAALGPDAGGA
jgi:pimeloyl-ACP methyl ester carboxylesterase